jgi:hypothetical protein
MRINKDIIIQFFRYLWIVAAIMLVFFIISQSFYTKRTLEYDLDFSQSISQNITGWYPEQRLTNLSLSSLGNAYDLIAEPVYMKIYTPINFDNMNITGTVYRYNFEDIKLGLKQTDGSWDYKLIDSKDFDFDFDLTEAQIKNNQLEIILSIPGMTTPTRLSLINNWQITLKR